VLATPVVANGTLYINTQTHLYAIAEGAKPVTPAEKPADKPAEKGATKPAEKPAPKSGGSGASLLVPNSGFEGLQAKLVLPTAVALVAGLFLFLRPPRRAGWNEVAPPREPALFHLVAFPLCRGRWLRILAVFHS